MSRNFELLRQVRKEEKLFQGPAEASVPKDGRKSRLDLDSLGSEEVIKLVQRLFLVSSGDTGPRMVLFSGVEHGGGCTWTCARAGEVLAIQDAGSVCLVDANLRSPGLHKYLGVENLRGLGEALLQPGPVREFVHKLPSIDLSLMPCGNVVSDPVALLASERLRSRLIELRTEFDFVLVDAPPMALYGDATMLGKLVDGVILVLGANSTRREAARKAKESLEAANVRLLGAVLNRRTFPIPEALYRKL